MTQTKLCYILGAVGSMLSMVLSGKAVYHLAEISVEYCPGYIFYLKKHQLEEKIILKLLGQLSFPYNFVA